MNCAWESYIRLLPPWMRQEVDKVGQETLQELRLRIGRPPEWKTSKGFGFLKKNVVESDLLYCMNSASNYSPWAASTVSDGYFTAAGGHRIGICGQMVTVNGRITTVKNLTSMCIRVARDFPGVGIRAAAICENLLILGSPGRGKTTLLRDIIRQKSNHADGAVAVVDERGELFPFIDGCFCFSMGLRTEVLTGCSKSEGIEMLIRTMNPEWIAVDEITAEADCTAMINAANCGVKLLATAHAESIEDYRSRPIYQKLVRKDIFKSVIVMGADKSWKLERVNI